MRTVARHRAELRVGGMRGGRGAIRTGSGIDAIAVASVARDDVDRTGRVGGEVDSGSAVALPVSAGTAPVRCRMLSHGWARGGTPGRGLVRLPAGSVRPGPGEGAQSSAWSGRPGTSGHGGNYVVRSEGFLDEMPTVGGVGAS